MEVKDWPLSNRTINALIKNNITNIQDLEGKSLDEVTKINGLGAKGLVELREWCKSKFGISFKREKKEKKKVIKNYKEARAVVEHLVPNTKDWARQLKVADQLIEKYGLDVLLKVVPDPAIYSLVWYNSSYGDAKIRTFMSKKVVEEEKKEEVKFEETSFFDIQVEKPKSIRDFLN